MPTLLRYTSFQPPAMGQRAIVKAHVLLDGVQQEIPAMFYQSPQGRAIIYPFTKALLGLVWTTQEDWLRLQCRLENVPTSIETLYLSRAADLSPEVINQLLIFFECHGGGATLNEERFNRWIQKLKKVNSEITMVVTCPLCTKENEINWFQLSHIGGTAAGVRCSQLGERCQSEIPSIGILPCQINLQAMSGTPLTMTAILGAMNASGLSWKYQ